MNTLRFTPCVTIDEPCLTRQGTVATSRCDVRADRAGGRGSGLGRKGRALFHPLRLALTAQEKGPEMAKLLPLIGRAKADARLARADGLKQKRSARRRLHGTDRFV